MISASFSDHILKAVEESQAAWAISTYHDNYVFGTTFWRNLRNRIHSSCQTDGSPFSWSPDKSLHAFGIGNFVIRHHRITKVSQVPRNARKAKEMAQQQCSLPFDAKNKSNDSQLQILLAIEATPASGLMGVSVGTIVLESDTDRFIWDERLSVILSDTPSAGFDNDIYSLNSTESDEVELPVQIVTRRKKQDKVEE